MASFHGKSIISAVEKLRKGHIMKATVKEQVKQVFRTYNFTEAWEITKNERKHLEVIMRERDINRMVEMTSKLAGNYNIKK